MSEQEKNGKVIHEMTETFNRTGEVPSLIPFLTNPETHEEANEIWQNWMKTCEKMTAHWGPVTREMLGTLTDMPHGIKTGVKE